MTWIIYNGTGKYVNQKGSENTFTNRPEKAERYPTKESAQRECCGNEWPVNLYKILDL